MSNDQATYKGTAKPFAKVYVHPSPGNPDIRRSLRHHVRHSPDGFSWGYGGSGPAELARCLLLDATGTDTGYQQFKFDVVARWPMDEDWTYTRREVRAWQDAYREVMSR